MAEMGYSFTSHHKAQNKQHWRVFSVTTFCKVSERVYLTSTLHFLWGIMAFYLKDVGVFMTFLYVLCELVFLHWRDGLLDSIVCGVCVCLCVVRLG